MSLDKAIGHGKEHRKPYTGSKAIDRTCRNHGGCDWCLENRRHKFRDKHPPDIDELTALMSRRGSTAEQLSRNQQIDGSNPSGGSQQTKGVQHGARM